MTEPDPPEPVTWQRIAALLEKRILACAPDVYQRVKTAVEASTVAALFEVVEHPWLKDGQVLSIDPAALKLPPPQVVIDPEGFKPQYRCLNCMRPTYVPGHCDWCAVFADGLRTPMTSAPGIITGLGT